MPSVATRRWDTKAPSTLKRNTPGRWPIEQPHTCPPQGVHSTRRLIVAPRGQNHARHRFTLVRVLERGRGDVNCDQLFWAVMSALGPTTGSKPEKLRIANVFRFAPESGPHDLGITPAASLLRTPPSLPRVAILTPVSADASMHSSHGT